MNTRITSCLILCLAATFALVGCNKTQKFSTRLADSTWNVTELVIDGTAETNLPSLEFKVCDDIYAALCEGHWKDANGEEVEFYWQLRSSSDEFELSYVAEAEEDDHGHNHAHGDVALSVMVSNLSGTYTYSDFSKTDITLMSSATGGYPGKVVTIKMTKQ
ncbi:MAG: hypothetical protein AAF570_26625 [Bacteroidota bacterium]